MSVDIKSLRIGSHILVNNKRERVRGLDEDNGLIIRFPTEYVLASDVEPIPITPELLEELGFEKFASNVFIKDIDSNYMENPVVRCYFLSLYGADYYSVEVYDDIENYGRLHCHYLHELESFIFLTIQEELIKD